VAFADFILKLLKDERLRRQTTTSGNTLIIIDPTPRLVNEQLELAFFIEDEQGMVVNGFEIAQAILQNENELITAVSKYYSTFC